MTAPDLPACLFLARSIAALAPAIRDLDGWLPAAPPEPVAGFVPPLRPTIQELHAAALVLDRAASCLRHAATTEGGAI